MDIMKSRVLILGLLIVSMMFFATAQDSPDIDMGGADVEDIQGAVDDFSPLDEDGEFDPDKYKPYKSKAEERIDKINLWLEENASWLKVVFGMVPSITWGFAMNLYLFLLALVILAFNGNATFGFFDSLSREIDLALFEVSLAQILGFVIFVMLLVMKIYVKLSVFILSLIDIIWHKVIPAGLVMAVIAIIVIIIILIALAFFAPQALVAIGKALEARREKKAKKKEEVNRKAGEKFIEGMTGKS